MNPTEIEIQRFMQIRNEIQDEISKIGPQVTQLQQAGKTLISHFDVFRQIVKETQTQLPVIIEAASHNMAKATVEQMSLILDTLLQDNIRNLNQSVSTAAEILQEATGLKYRKMIFFLCLGILLSGLMGFGGGYIYARQNTYALPADFIKMYALGLSVKDGVSEIKAQETTPQNEKGKRQPLKEK